MDKNKETHSNLKQSPEAASRKIYYTLKWNLKKQNNMNYYQQHVSLGQIHARKIIVNWINHKPLDCETSTLQHPFSKQIQTRTSQNPAETLYSKCNRPEEKHKKTKLQMTYNNIIFSYAKESSAQRLSHRVPGLAQSTVSLCDSSTSCSAERHRAVICPWAGRPRPRPCREAAEVLEEEASLCVRLSL